MCLAEAATYQLSRQMQTAFWVTIFTHVVSHCRCYLFSQIKSASCCYSDSDKNLSDNVILVSQPLAEPQPTWFYVRPHIHIHVVLTYHTRVSGPKQLYELATIVHCYLRCVARCEVYNNGGHIDVKLNASWFCLLNCDRGDRLHLPPPPFPTPHHPSIFNVVVRLVTPPRRDYAKKLDVRTAHSHPKRTRNTHTPTGRD